MQMRLAISAVVLCALFMLLSGIIDSMNYHRDVREACNELNGVVVWKNGPRCNFPGMQRKSK